MPVLSRSVLMSAATLLCAALAVPAFSQTPQITAPPLRNRPQQQQLPPAEPRPQKPPAVMDPAGPTVGLEPSESLFDMAVALNACGYDNGLDESDPVRKRVRDEVNQAAEQSADARNARDQMCLFIAQHHLSSDSRDLAQYVSLALYLTPPPVLEPSVEDEDLPPDASAVEGILPSLRAFAKAIDLHVIWVTNRPSYEAAINKLHDPLTNMIVETNTYLKMPASTYGGKRFLVVIEPMLSPADVNARVYGTDYVVVVSPVNGTIRMQDVRHTYLHYEIEPLLYSKSSSMDRMLPILKTVREAPLDFNFRSDIVALTIECMIRAIEARTMDTGIAVYKIPDNIDRADLPKYEHLRSVSLQQIAAAREKAVQEAMAEGFVLTQYFYDQMIAFEKTPTGLKDSIGEMVYGMDVDRQVHRARDVTFNQEPQSTGDVVSRAPLTLHGLDLAEMKLMKGDADGAGKIAEQSLKDRTPDPGRANFILARVSLMKGDMETAQNDFTQAVKLSKDPRTMAWSHIYLGRIYDVQDERDQALAEYHDALNVRDGQQDTRLAAERGLKKPFELPHHDGAADGPAGSAPAGSGSAAAAPASATVPAPQ
ncbi:tetratricopeptide repeat protein [Acidipila rosea]|uniref:Uncharacterized protein n=1 Tax=Acidipila rosea TaxID=768535 RepID=A0A4V2PUS2_9BACT|nr:hypothetical protein [Acidipila rosea]TCK71601.1 hypothetical protein C7378_2881 [Acidipila rosea]